MQILVVGGGAAGMMAALTAAKQGCRVRILEKNDKLGKKLRITGKGRCNVTNNCTLETLLTQIPRNARFLNSAFHAFSPADTMAFFENLGCPLKTERGQRVFPVSDRAEDVVGVLKTALHRAGVKIDRVTVKDLLIQDGTCLGVTTEKKQYTADAVILATGGASYPLTGSTGDGYRLAAQAGHTIVPPRGSLVPLEVLEEDCPRAQGLSLRNVNFKVINGKGKPVFSEQGELLFTHFGLSGPLVLSASAHMVPEERYRCFLDLKPALEPAALDARLLRDFEKYKNRNFQNALTDLLPEKLIPIIVDRSGIPPELKVNSITKTQRKTLCELMKNYSLTITGMRPVEEAIITAGGVRTSQLVPGTMASKCCKGLYIAGELLDCDAYTGGFNLQIAWSTGYCAGLGAAKGE